MTDPADGGDCYPQGITSWRRTASWKAPLGMVSHWSGACTSEARLMLLKINHITGRNLNPHLTWCYGLLPFHLFLHQSFNSLSKCFRTSMDASRYWSSSSAEPGQLMALPDAKLPCPWSILSALLHFWKFSFILMLVYKGWGLYGYSSSLRSDEIEHHLTMLETTPILFRSNWVEAPVDALR